MEAKEKMSICKSEFLNQKINEIKDSLMTAHALNKLFTIDHKMVSYFISSKGISPKKVEECKVGVGYRRLYLVQDILDKVSEVGAEITPSKLDIEKVRIENEKFIIENELLSEHEKLTIKINNLNEEIKKKERHLSSLKDYVVLHGKKIKILLNEPLLDEDDILLLAGIRKKRCGIYFLIKGEEIVYVGQSTNIFYRVGQHEGVKDFDTFTYLECDKEHLDLLEARYITKIKPKYNFNSLGNLVLPISKGFIDEQLNIFKLKESV